MSKVFGALIAIAVFSMGPVLSYALGLDITGSLILGAISGVLSGIIFVKAVMD